MFNDSATFMGFALIQGVKEPELNASEARNRLAPREGQKENKRKMRKCRMDVKTRDDYD